MIRFGDPRLERYFRKRYARIRSTRKGPIRRAPNVYGDGVEPGVPCQKCSQSAKGERTLGLLKGKAASG